MNAVHLLIWSGAFELLVSSLLGLILLIPMQPWGKSFLSGVHNIHDLRSTHLDWLMLAFMQFAAAFGLSRVPISGDLFAAGLLVFGGWMNAFPYLIRGIWGMNAFQLSGNWKQRAAATLGLVSVLSILVGWAFLVMKWFPLVFVP